MVVRASIDQLPCHGFDHRDRPDPIFRIGRTPGTERKYVRREDKKLITEMWMRGFTYSEIASVLEVDAQVVAQWRRKLGLPKRKPGNYLKSDRIAHMAENITHRIDEEKLEPLRDIFLRWGVLDSAGRHVNGTDKQTNHRYGDAYDDLFRAYDLDLHGWYSTRKQVKLMMEVGIADGSSLLAWSDAFPNATCVGLDVHPPSWPGITPAQMGRVEFHKGDQRSKEDCERAAAGRQFDFICEDAVHSTENTLLTLFWLWPHVKPGGLYVVEEWANILSDWPRVKALLPLAETKETFGPSGGTEPLVILRKPL